MNNALEKISNPLNFYENPEDVEKDEALTVEEKIKVLTSWLDDIKLRQIAEAENMQSYHQNHYHMAEVERLLFKFQQENKG